METGTSVPSFVSSLPPIPTPALVLREATKPVKYLGFWHLFCFPWQLDELNLFTNKRNESPGLKASEQH